MPEQQLLKPTEWSYCDYFWVGVASVSLCCDPNGSICLGRVGRVFLWKPLGVVSSLVSRSFSRIFQQSLEMCVVFIHGNRKCREAGRSSPPLLGGGRRLELLLVKESELQGC